LKKIKKMKQLYFQSSLPRAGSTLLQNIVAQNPDFYCTPTSGVIEFIASARTLYSQNAEFLAQDPKEMEKAFKGFCAQGMQGYFSALTDKPCVLDKSRGWGYQYRFLDSFYPNPKIVCMVRDPRDIYASLEKAYRRNPHKDPGLVNFAEMKNTTVEKRIDSWSQGLLVGLSFERIYEIIKNGTDKHIHFIKYETFTRQPEKEMRKLYKYFELPYFKHDFDNIQQLTYENDVMHGIFGDHQIKTGKIIPSKSEAKEILGNHGANWVKEQYGWFYDYFKYT